jgi:hypothetical protein
MLSQVSKDSDSNTEIKPKMRLLNTSNIETIEEIPRDQRLLREYLDKNKFI